MEMDRKIPGDGCRSGRGRTLGERCGRGRTLGEKRRRGRGRTLGERRRRGRGRTLGKRRRSGRNPRRGGRQGCRGLVFVLPSLAGVMVFYVIPYLDVVRRAFTETLTGKFVGSYHFCQVLANPAFRLAAWNTARMMAVSVPVLVVFSLLLAVPLQKGIRGGRWIRSGLLIPLAIPAASAVLLWQCIFAEQGFLNGCLNLFGIQGTDWMKTGYAFWVLVFSYVWKNLGYSVILWIAALDGISPEIYEAARIDGAGERVIFFGITVPNLFLAFFTITVLSLINSFKVFREAYLVAGDYPDESIYMLQHLFNNWYRNLDMDKMAAGAVISGTVLIVMVYLFWMKLGNARNEDLFPAGRGNRMCSLIHKIGRNRANENVRQKRGEQGIKNVRQKRGKQGIKGE